MLRTSRQISRLQGLWPRWQAAPARGLVGSLQSLRLDSTVVRELPGDSDTSNVPRLVNEAFYTPVEPTPVPEPRLRLVEERALEAVGLSPSVLDDEGLFADVFSGNATLEGSHPIAYAYGGHQFGNWAGQLGDGRAISIGQTVGGDGKRWELQLKGAGQTPYCRFADGRAVLRSSVREFLASEYMAAVGVPTTRALSLVTTGEPVMRDMFYSGNPRPEPGAIVCRAAHSFMRIGSFQLLQARGEDHNVQVLVDHVAPLVLGAEQAAALTDRDRCLELLKAVSRLNAELVASWLGAGFTHGVLNTDNVSLLGLTLDYGPYGFVEQFDPTHVPNMSDTEGRYDFRSQASVMAWNLVRFGASLLPILPEEEVKEVLGEFAGLFHEARAEVQRKKLGLSQWEGDRDEDLYMELLGLMAQSGADFTNTFRALSHVRGHGDPYSDGEQPQRKDSGEGEDSEEGDAPAVGPLRPVLHDAQYDASLAKQWEAWGARYQSRLAEEVHTAAQDEDRRAAMLRVNPKFVPRNYLMHEATQAAEMEGDYSALQELHRVLRSPFEEHVRELPQPCEPAHLLTHSASTHLRQPSAPAHFSQPAPEWARARPGVTTLSCSS